jgi:hypothetical protein
MNEDLVCDDCGRFDCVFDAIESAADREGPG